MQKYKRHFSEIICPAKFNFRKYKDKVLDFFNNINISEIRKKVKKKLGKRKYFHKKNADSQYFGELLEDYIYKKWYSHCIRQYKVVYMDIVGMVDFYDTNKNSVIEVKYSTFIPVDKLIEIYKMQALAYSFVLGANKYIIVAANPIEDKLKFVEFKVNTEEIFRLQNIIRGEISLNIDYHCYLCDIYSCPVKKILNRNERR